MGGKTKHVNRTKNNAKVGIHCSGGSLEKSKYILC